MFYIYPMNVIMFWFVLENNFELCKQDKTYYEPFFIFGSTVKEDLVPKVYPILQRYTHVKKQNLLLCLEFTTLAEYLWLLRVVCESLHKGDTNVLLYLAAAVADFYIPADQMVRVYNFMYSDFQQ